MCFQIVFFGYCELIYACLWCVWVSDELKSFFSEYGKVVEHEIIRDHTTKRSRGFGFIVFDSDKVVDNLLADGNMIDMAGTQVSSVWFFREFGTSNAHYKVVGVVVTGFNVKGCCCKIIDSWCFLLLPNNVMSLFKSSVLLLLFDSWSELTVQQVLLFLCARQAKEKMCYE